MRNCGYQSTPASAGSGGSASSIYRNINNFPDIKVLSVLIVNGGATRCTGYTGTGTTSVYYVDLYASLNRSSSGAYYPGQSFAQRP